MNIHLLFSHVKNMLNIINVQSNYKPNILVEAKHILQFDMIIDQKVSNRDT